MLGHEVDGFMRARVNAFGAYIGCGFDSDGRGKERHAATFRAGAGLRALLAGRLMARHFLRVRSRRHGPQRAAKRQERRNGDEQNPEKATHVVMVALDVADIWEGKERRLPDGDRKMGALMNLDEAFASELLSAKEAFRRTELDVAFRHLERAHILGQRRTGRHAVVHWWMLRVGLRRKDAREVLGQMPRIIAALVFSRIWVPLGNTGGANVSAFKPMPIPEELRRWMDHTR